MSIASADFDNRQILAPSRFGIFQYQQQLLAETFFVRLIDASTRHQVQ